MPIDSVVTKKILCVDDEPSIRQVYELLPSYLGPIIA